MAEFEISFMNNQEVFPVNEEEIEKNVGLILDYVFKNKKIFNESVLKDFDLSGKTVSVDLVVTDNEEIEQLNTSYRGKEKPTDVLTFALFADSSEKEVLAQDEIPLGEVIISVETAKLQADQNGISLQEEIDFLLCHGIMHLLGFTHPDQESLDVLLGIQSEILSAIK